MVNVNNPTAPTGNVDVPLPKESACSPRSMLKTITDDATAGAERANLVADNVCHGHDANAPCAENGLSTAEKIGDALIGTTELVAAIPEAAVGAVAGAAYGTVTEGNPVVGTFAGTLEGFQIGAKVNAAVGGPVVGGAVGIVDAVAKCAKEKLSGPKPSGM